MPLEKALLPAEIADLLNLPLAQFYKLAARGKLPLFKVGNQWRAKPSALDLFMRGEWKPVVKRRPGRQLKVYPAEFNPATDIRFQ